MIDPITGLAIETGKEVFEITKPQQKVFLNFIFLKLFGGKSMMLYNEKTRAEIENTYNLKKLEGKLELKKIETIGNFEIQKIEQEQQILLEINKYEKELEAKHIAGVIQKSIGKIEENAEGNIDPDKFKRLKDLSKEFSSEDMQEIISGILAGEYNQSGSFSLKTMDIVRSLSRDEINLFKKFCGLVIDGDFIFGNFFNLNNKNHLEIHKKGISYNDYLYLQELGLFTGSNTSQKIDGNSSYSFIIANKKVILNLGKEITLNNQSNLTKAGKELYKLIEPIFDEELFNMCKEELIKQGFDEM